MVFNGSTNQVLVLAYNPPGCLKVIDAVIDADNPNLPKPVDRAYYLSNLSLVDSSVSHAALPESIFGEEPLAGWCTYFEKADLARQNGDWQQVAELADKALAHGSVIFPVGLENPFTNRV